MKTVFFQAICRFQLYINTVYSDYFLYWMFFQLLCWTFFSLFFLIYSVVCPLSTCVLIVGHFIRLLIYCIHCIVYMTPCLYWWLFSRLILVIYCWLLACDYFILLLFYNASFLLFSVGLLLFTYLSFSTISLLFLIISFMIVYY